MALSLRLVGVLMLVCPVISDMSHNETFTLAGTHKIALTITFSPANNNPFKLSFTAYKFVLFDPANEGAVFLESEWVTLPSTVNKNIKNVREMNVHTPSARVYTSGLNKNDDHKESRVAQLAKNGQLNKYKLEAAVLLSVETSNPYHMVWTADLPASDDQPAPYTPGDSADRHIDYFHLQQVTVKYDDTEIKIANYPRDDMSVKMDGEFCISSHGTFVISNYRVQRISFKPDNDHYIF